MPNHQEQLDQLFHALADKNRRAIIDSLSHGDRSVSDLREPLGISLPATMQHLGILEDAGLVKSAKQGRIRTCTLDRTALSHAEKWIQERRRFWSNQLDLLGDFLVEQDAAVADKPARKTASKTAPKRAGRPPRTSR